MKKNSFLLALSVMSVPAFAQEQPAPVVSNYLMDITIIVFIVAALLLMVVALVLLKTFKTLSSELVKPSVVAAQQPAARMEWEEWKKLEKSKPGIWNKILGLKPIEHEKDLLLEHEFDGISELDNPTPAWFMWLFYVSIISGVFYFLNYHVFEWGKSQEQEYVAEMEHAKLAKEAYLAKSANLIDENTVKESREEAVLTAGASVYKANCVACHGDQGQGVVGPNLADEYWLHGGKVGDIFKTIKYGIPEKGMISWEKTLTPKQISDVTNYIKSLQGSNPANPKAPQGEKES